MNPTTVRARVPLEILLAVLSFVFHKLARLVILHVVVRAYVAFMRRGRTGWRILSAPELRRPLALPILMTTGPRWNVHAAVAFVGPLAVRRCIKLEVATAARSARSWSIVIHAAPGHRKVVTTVGSRSAAALGTWHEVPVPPGSYWLTARYYDWAPAAALPAVLADGVEVVVRLPVPRDVNAFYATLKAAASPFYLALHYYVGPLLRHAGRLPEWFVRREYLPAGNPDTQFYYGALDGGVRLGFEIDPRLLRTHDVYFAAYSRASFPLLWYRIREPLHTTAPMPEPGTFLVRVHETRPSDRPFVREWLRVQPLPEPAVAATRRAAVARVSN